MIDLHVSVNNKIATYQKRDGDIVCGNSDYQIKFTFDEEWEAYENKTARFVWGGQFQDVEFTGDTCPVPILSGVTLCEVGVYAGELCTTTSAFIGCKTSILCQPASPSVENDKYWANEARKYAEEAKTYAEDAQESGATFTPSVSADGTLSWTNDKGLENPSPVNIKGGKGDTGAGGKDGKDGVSVTHEWDGTTLKITSASGTSYIDPTIVTPLFANSVEELKVSGDTSKLYVLPDGYIYAYMTSTVEQEVTKYDEIIGTADEPYSENSRLGSDGSVSTLAGYTVTPYIDLTKAEYQGKTVEIHLDGNRYASEARENYIQCGVYDSNKSAIYIRPFTTLDRTDSNCVLNVFDNAGMTLSIKDTTSAIMTVPIPLEDDSGNTVSYMRFCGLGTVTNTVAIYYKTMETVTGMQWTNTGFLFINNGVDEETAKKIATLNNEGADPTTVSLLPAVVKDFYNSAAYSSEDYSTSHLERITYPCRADIPIPYTVKWSHNENAMRTTVAVDTKAIGTSNAHTLLTYDATGVDNYPLYNLIPNKTYYYKVTHLLSDGSLVEAKSGSFKTSSEAWRLIYIDGTQNVRDLGGWTGLDGKKVRYGKIFRGAAFSDSSYPELMLTGKGKRSLGELKIQAELNLGAIDTETSIAANCSYKKVGYTSYATAITSETHKAMFKELLEYIISCLDGTLTETGLYTVERNIYMHCQGGCDRTGTLSFLLLGLLGVSESDLAKEYELSSFSNIGIGRLRTTTAAVNVYDYVGMVEAIKTYTGDTIADKFVSFATACGISSDTITSFRNLMLE